MTDDIVKRLRDHAVRFNHLRSGWGRYADVANEAADRITELETENARLRVAVAAFLDAESTLWCCAECMTAAPHLADLRRVLEDDL